MNFDIEKLKGLSDKLTNRKNEKIELNRIYQMDCLEGLSLLENNSIDLIITSPPYNKAGFNGKNKRTDKCIWNKTIDYGGNVEVDNMNETDYQEWQIKILNECFRVLKPNGSMFYNHKLRVKNNKASFPLEWINKSKFIFRQMIIWDRSTSPNLDKCRYIPSTEYIFWLIKEQKNPRFERLENTLFPTEVWKSSPVKNSKHPAPFPIELVDNIIPNVAQGEKITVLNPFMGSGTVALSAIKHHCNYIGFDLFTEYLPETLVG